MSQSTLAALLEKYDVPVPRYTSYPPVPHWGEPPGADAWTRSLTDCLSSPEASLAVYVHLPFCETLCTFCGCNTVITRNHERGDAYVDVVLAELDSYLSRIPILRERPVWQLHLGGGTPTFLSPRTLDVLLKGLAARLGSYRAGFEGSVEVDPRVTTTDHLDVLSANHINRISLGVQDIDDEVLRLVNRPQPIEITERLCHDARTRGYESINFDLIYGLPGQTPSTMRRLGTAVLATRPDRLAVYSFARVPWIKPAQRKFKDDDVPAGALKRELYEVLRGQLLDGGYEEVGMDHFALPHDALAISAREGRLHRNFMGYTDRRTSALLGLGVSAISETPGCYHQNEKVITVYERRVAAGEIPTLRGHVLSDEDRRRGAHIRALMTTGATTLDVPDASSIRDRSSEFVRDGLLEVSDARLQLTSLGKPFVRNIAALFDDYLAASGDAPRYSRAI